MYRGNQACLTPHIWLSRIDKLDYPDQLVFDLDPSGDSFESVKAAAQSLNELHGSSDYPRTSRRPVRAVLTWPCRSNGARGLIQCALLPGN
jgi:hypothetical protein